MENIHSILSSGIMVSKPTECATLVMADEYVPHETKKSLNWLSILRWSITTILMVIIPSLITYGVLSIPGAIRLLNEDDLTVMFYGIFLAEVLIIIGVTGYTGELFKYKRIK